MIEEKSDVERVIRAYLSLPNANAVMGIIKLLERYEDNDYEEDIEKYITSPADIMDDSERSLSLLTIIKRHGIKLLNTLGVITDEEYENETRISVILELLDNLASLNELDTIEYINILSLKDEVGSDLEFIIKYFSLDDNVDISSAVDLIIDVSPILIKSINETAINNLEVSDIEPLDIKNESIKSICNILDYIKSKLDIETPDEVIKSLLNKGYVEGLNDTYVNDLIKPIKINIERYEDEKLFLYLYHIATSLLFIHTINKEDEPLLLALDAVQDYLQGSSIPDMNRKLINVNNIFNTSKIYDYLKDDNEQ